ncbi:hypothetical protein Tco_0349774 [Tanacetum coccineum]
MRALLIQHGGEAEVLPIDMEAQTKAELNQKAHSALILCLANIEVKFKDADLLLLLLTSLPASYEHLVDTLLFGRESLALDDVMATLNSKEIKERSKAKGGDGEGLYVRGRTDRRDSYQLRGKPRSKSRGGSLKCYILQSNDHLKRNRTKNNHKKLTGYIKKDDHPSSSGSIYDDYKVIMVMSAKECDGGSVLLGDNKECKIRGLCKSGNVKVINGSSVVLSGTRRDNYLYSLDGHVVASELKASVEKVLRSDALSIAFHTTYKLSTKWPRQPPEEGRALPGLSLCGGSHVLDGCPKNINSDVVKNMKKPSQTPRGVPGRLVIEGKVTLVDDDGKPLKKVDSSGDHDNEEEVASVDNDMENFLDSKKDGYGQDIPNKIQDICDNFDITVRGRKKK